MQTKQCLTEQELTDFDLGNLAAEKYEVVSQHLDSCESCAGRFEILDQQSDAVVANLRLKLPQEILGEDSELNRLIDAAAALGDTSLNGLADTRDGEVRRKKSHRWIRLQRKFSLARRKTMNSVGWAAIGC